VDATTSKATENARTGEAHASGAALIAVAEGNAEAQPDEATLGHIFSCDRCGEHVREIRSSMASLGIKPDRSKPAAPRPAASLTELSAALPSMSAPSSTSSSNGSAVDLGEMPLATEDSSDRARKMIWKIAILGTVLGGALYYMRSFAGGLH